MKTILQGVVLFATLTGAPALAETTNPPFTLTKADLDGAQRLASLQRQIGALRADIGRIELQRLVDRISTDRPHTPKLEVARIGPR